MSQTNLFSPVVASGITSYGPNTMSLAGGTTITTSSVAPRRVAAQDGKNRRRGTRTVQAEVTANMGVSTEMYDNRIKTTRSVDESKRMGSCVDASSLSIREHDLVIAQRSSLKAVRGRNEMAVGCVMATVNGLSTQYYTSHEELLDDFVVVGRAKTDFDPTEGRSRSGIAVQAAGACSIVNNSVHRIHAGDVLSWSLPSNELNERNALMAELAQAADADPDRIAPILIPSHKDTAQSRRANALFKYHQSTADERKYTKTAASPLNNTGDSSVRYASALEQQTLITVLAGVSTLVEAGILTYNSALTHEALNDPAVNKAIVNELTRNPPLKLNNNRSIIKYERTNGGAGSRSNNNNNEAGGVSNFSAKTEGISDDQQKAQQDGLLRIAGLFGVVTFKPEYNLTKATPLVHDIVTKAHRGSLFFPGGEVVSDGANMARTKYHSDASSTTRLAGNSDPWAQLDAAQRNAPQNLSIAETDLRHKVERRRFATALSSALPGEMVDVVL